MDNLEGPLLSGHAREGHVYGSGTPRVLIATTTWWAFPARIAMEFRRAGVIVDVICPRGQPIRATSCVDRTYHYGALKPQRSLKRAIERARPAIVVPCDDRVVGHLHALHARCRGDAIAAIIEASIGPPSSYPVVASRADFISFARRQGVRAPEMVEVAHPGMAVATLGRLGLPAVVKADGTWGGLGVEIVHSAHGAAAAVRRSQQPLTAARAIKRLLVDRDPFHLLTWLHRDVPKVGIQAFASGRPANCIAACSNGRVLALLCVEVVATSSALGAATVVRVIENAEMTLAATRLVAGLGLSGFCGFDFLLDAATGHAELLEINPRSTPLCHLALSNGRAPVAAMAAALCGRAGGDPPHAVDAATIAYFPQAWHTDPNQEALHLGLHDVPWQEPALLRALLRKPRPDRGLLAALLRRVRRLAPNRLRLPIVSAPAERETTRLGWPIPVGERNGPGVQPT